jgi:hypothetical protein
MQAQEISGRRYFRQELVHTKPPVTEGERLRSLWAEAATSEPTPTVIAAGKIGQPNNTQAVACQLLGENPTMAEDIVGAPPLIRRSTTHRKEQRLTQ